MKGLLLLILSSIVISAIAQDVTTLSGITSFEIKLDRRSPSKNLGFNTTNIDRHHIYSVVADVIKNELHAGELQSIHSPEVVLMFDEYINQKKRLKRNAMSSAEISWLQNGKYNYFVKIFGNLDVNNAIKSPSASFSLKVYIFNQDGMLISKTKSRSTSKLYTLTDNEMLTEADYPITEGDFIQLVKEAATTLEITM